MLAIAIAASLYLGGVAHAQQGALAQTSADQDKAGEDNNKESSEPVELGAVMVTARRHKERMVDVPIAMTAMTGVEIQKLGLSNIADVISMTPGAASVSNGGGFTQVQIRGVSTSLGGNANGYYLDGVPFTGVTVPWYPDARSWDIARVEVLKGPQGTTFGEGSMGGTVRIITRKPAFNYFEAAVDMSASTTDGGGNGWGVKAMANVPLIEDKLAVRFAATDETLAGWIDDANTGEEDINETRVKTARIKLRFAPTERLNINLSYWDYSLESDDGTNKALDDMTVPSYASIDYPWTVKSLVATYDFDGSQLFYAWGDASLTSESHGTLGAGVAYDSTINLGVRTQELRWSSTGEKSIDWIVGYYLRKATRNDQLALGAVPPSGSNQVNDGYAVYGETIFTFPDDRWALTTGLRYFSDKVVAQSQTESKLVSLDAKFDSWSPHVGLSFQAAENTLLYANVAKGFRSGQLQPITSYILAEAAGLELPVKIKPDSIITYELGVKTQLAGPKLILRGDIFYSEWKDVAVRVPINENFNGLANSDGTRNQGVELNLSWRPLRNLRMQVGGSWIDAVYVSDVPNTPLHEGTPVYNVPKVTLNGSVDYRHPIKPGLSLVMRGTVRHNSRRETALTQGTPGDYITEVGLRAGIESGMGWSLYLYGDNITNEDGAVNARYMDGTAVRLRPRTWGVEFRYNY